MAHNTAEPTTSPYTLLGAELAPFWSGSSMIGAALFIELIQLSLERWLLLELISSFFWTASLWSELLWLLLWTGPDPPRAEPTPSGAVAPLWSWSDPSLKSGGSSWSWYYNRSSSGSSGAEAPHQSPSGSSMEPLCLPLERRLPSWSSSGSSGATTLPWSHSGSIWSGDSLMESLWLL